MVYLNYISQQPMLAGWRKQSRCFPLDFGRDFKREKRRALAVPV